MKNFKSSIKRVFTLASVFSVLPVSATVSIDWVTVGNAGNAADPLTGYGAVSHNYRIGKYEVTNAQYAEFLNAKAAMDSYGLYNTNMAAYGITRNGSAGSFNYSVSSALANRPVAYVSWFDAARFANWLANGQRNGDTETGSYILNGAMSGIFFANAAAQVYLPTENEWYKAAYYNSMVETYSLYPNGQNSINVLQANYDWSIGSTTDVGSYSSISSSYGTFDQGGNVWEITDSLMNGYGEWRVVRGGSYLNGNGIGFGGNSDLLSLNRYENDPAYDERSFLGFRLASIPEPSFSMMIVTSTMGLIIRRRKP